MEELYAAQMGLRGEIKRFYIENPVFIKKKEYLLTFTGIFIYSSYTEANCNVSAAVKFAGIEFVDANKLSYVTNIFITSTS